MGKAPAGVTETLILNFTDMNKITSDSMLLELAGTVNAVPAILLVHPEIVEQMMLDTIARMSTVSNCLTTAYNRDCVKNDSREANRERDDAIALLMHLAKGFARYPKRAEAARREAGARLYAIVKKYRRMSHLSYDAQSAAMESLYLELNEPEAQADIRLLGDEVSNAVELIRTTDLAFRNARAEYCLRYVNRGPAAGHYRKELLDLFNNVFVPHLTALMNIDEATYGAFGREVEARIKRLNQTVRQRAERRRAARAKAAARQAKEESGEEMSEQAADVVNETTAECEQEAIRQANLSDNKEDRTVMPESELSTGRCAEQEPGGETPISANAVQSVVRQSCKLDSSIREGGYEEIAFDPGLRTRAGDEKLV